MEVGSLDLILEKSRIVSIGSGISTTVFGAAQ